MWHAKDTLIEPGWSPALQFCGSWSPCLRKSERRLSGLVRELLGATGRLVRSSKLKAQEKVRTIKPQEELALMPFGNSRVVSRTTVPEGQRESSPAFQRREGPRKNLSPEGTAERVRGRAIFQPSLRDLFWCGLPPSVETPGYFHLSLRDIQFRISERH